MNFHLIHLRSFPGREERRIARRFVSFNTSTSCRHLASYRPLWDGTDPAMRGLVAAAGGCV